MHLIDLAADILASNEALARHLRQIFADHGVYVINLMSGPGAGKTTVLERTLDALGDRYRVAVIEGDVQTRADADRVAAHGVPVVQINTGGACHLEARQIQEHLPGFDLHALDLLIIENVGDLVCPAEFDLGEHDKIMLLSTTEGADTPSKYPVMFHEARALLLNKIDLLPYLDFDLDKALHDSRALNPTLDVFQVSAKTGQGMEAWIAWLERRILDVKRTATEHD